jgi:hypothetical protein
MFRAGRKNPRILTNREFHTLPLARQETLLEIFGALSQLHTPEAAERWLETQIMAKAGERLPRLFLVPRLFLASRLKPYKMDDEANPPRRHA